MGRSRLQRQSGALPELRALDEGDLQDDDSVSQAPTRRSDAGSMASNAMSAWLGEDIPRGAGLTPFELADWLRTLPKDRLDGETLKAVARHVLDREIDEEQFGTAVAAGALGTMGVLDPRQQKVLERYFKQIQTEAVMA